MRPSAWTFFNSKSAQVVAWHAAQFAQFNSRAPVGHIQSAAEAGAASSPSFFCLILFLFIVYRPESGPVELKHRQ